ncbi:MAG TPA: glycosyltransferase family 4 protein [Opitutaceae bacterium]|nr:glycosyltransferase family 4 protein [Opitutaceae bacterium]
MNILNVAFPLSPVGCDAVGGAEQILTALDAALVRAGHRSLVIACAGSRCAGELIATPGRSERALSHSQPGLQAHHRATIERVLAEEPVDLVHLHGIDFTAYLPRPPVPVLATLHLPPAWYPTYALPPARPATHLNCVSRSQARNCPAACGDLPVIENGVPTAALQWRGRKADYVAWLGRICPEKGVHLAIEAARLAGVALQIAGRVFPFAAHETYFAEEIRPHLGARCRFLGPARFAEKPAFLGQARALLVTSTVPETSSLVAMEALACGTPVVAFRRGALEEIVEPGVTGFLVQDTAEMAEAIAAAAQLDPEVCRERARRRFSLERMTARYLALYGQLIAAETAADLEGTLSHASA